MEIYILCGILLIYATILAEIFAKELTKIDLDIFVSEWKV